MKYILYLAFEYKYYKKPGVIELFADDRLIDSIELKESIGRKDGELIEPYDRPDKPVRLASESGYAPFTKRKFNDLKHGKWKHWADKWSVCEKFFALEIEGDMLKNKLTLNIKNDHNNYTNGFMTKFSYFRFDAVGLIPKKYFYNIDLVNKDLPDVLGINHGRSSRYDLDEVQDWTWPGPRTSLSYDIEKDCWSRDPKDNIISHSPTLGKSFRVDMDITTWNGIKVIKPRNISDRLLNELYCLMEPVFLTYLVRSGLINSIT
tara:strand:- start:1331 stop:2116 length:786 start_codon:yes stop_codon:yes gene_type:complete